MTVKSAKLRLKNPLMQFSFNIPLVKDIITIKEPTMKDIEDMPNPMTSARMNLLLSRCSTLSLIEIRNLTVADGTRCFNVLNQLMAGKQPC